MSSNNPPKRSRAAQVDCAEKAAATKRKNTAKTRAAALRSMPGLVDASEPAAKAPKRNYQKHDHAYGAQAPPDLDSFRLLSKNEVCGVVGATFQTIWAWQRSGRFPRSRIVGGKSMWLSTEVRDWLAALPVRPLKGDPPEDA